MTLRLHHLRLVSFNCRDWYNARSTVADLPVSYDICLIQEHWLFSDHLYQLNFNPDFLSVGVSGMESSILLWWVRNSFQEIIDHAYSLNTDIQLIEEIESITATPTACIRCYMNMVCRYCGRLYCSMSEFSL